MRTCLWLTILLLVSTDVQSQKAANLKVSHLVLYQPDSMVRSRIKSEQEFVDFIDDIQQAAGEALERIESAPPQSGAIVVVVRRSQLMRVWFSVSRGELDPKDRATIVAALERVPVMSVIGGPVAFAVGYSADGSPPAATELPVPPEWLRAVPKDKAVQLPDEIIDVIWPDEDE